MVFSRSRSAALLVGKISLARKEWEQCTDFVNLREYPEGSRSDFIARCRRGEYDDVVVLCRSNEWTKLTGPFDRDLVSQLPPGLRYICSNGAGYDDVDVQACSERGIAVSNTQMRVNDATADTTILLILCALRRISIPLIATRKGQWKGQVQIGHDPEGKVLGILGMGNIGKAVARKAQAFGMKMQYTNRSGPVDDLDGIETAEHVSFHQLLQTSDVLSLHVPLSSSSQYIISRQELQDMKDGVTIVNTSRGRVIDEAALVEALQSGKVFSAGLDVFEKEPAIHPGLLENENTVLLPHIATFTEETRRSMELLVLDNLREAILNQRLINQVRGQRVRAHRL